MQIFGGSNSNHDGGFLHAGYVSAYPHPYGIDSDILYELKEGLLVEDINECVIDVAGSLELIEEDQEYAETIEIEPTLSASAFHYPHDDTLSRRLHVPVIVIVAFAVIGMFAVIRGYKKTGSSPAKALGLTLCISTILLGGAFLTLFYILGSIFGPMHAIRRSPPVRDPHKITIESLPEPERDCQYNDPDAATQTIIHAILTPAITGIPRYNFLAMEDIREEVGLPLPPNQMTPGMRYAVAHYDRDGWGSPIQVKITQTTYEITSLGPDCELETEDDICLTLPHDVSENWEKLISGVFISPSEEKLFNHRIASPLYEMYDPKDAYAATGGRLFDVVHQDYVKDEYKELLEASLVQEEKLSRLYFVGRLLHHTKEIEMAQETQDELGETESATEEFASEENL